MPGQQDPRGELDRSDQLDPRDSTADLSGLISRSNNGSFSNGINDRGKGKPDNGVGISKAIGGNSSFAGNSGGAGNSGVSEVGDTVPYVRPPRRAAVTPVEGAHAAVTPKPERPGANGHGAIAAQPATSIAEPLPATSALPGPLTPLAPAARPERPAPGSLADLRQRLERLPYGHPSSPYHVDGERKPPPHRLKHLELAPHAPGRITQAHSHPLVVEDDPITASPDSPAPAITPDPLTPASAQGVPPGRSGSRGQAILTEDQIRIADDAYDRFRAAEGRNLFGSYGSTGLTVVIRDLAAGLEYGELAPETEPNSLLEPDAFKARFAAMLARYPDRSAELLARRIPGAISYSFIFDAERYSAGIWMVQDAMTTAGFQLLGRRNDWKSTANRCVATMWHDPTSGLPFEAQFHTAASLEAQQLARSSASLISDPRVPSAEAANLRSDLAAAWAALPAPPGHGQIGDYRRDGGPPPGNQGLGSQPPPGGPPPASTANG